MSTPSTSKRSLRRRSKCSFLLELPFSASYPRGILQSTEQGLDEQRDEYKGGSTWRKSARPRSRSSSRKLKPQPSACVRMSKNGRRRPDWTRSSIRRPHNSRSAPRPPRVTSENTRPISKSSSQRKSLPGSRVKEKSERNSFARRSLLQQS